MLTEGVESIRDAHALATRILSALNQAFTVESGEVHVRGSIGIATPEPAVENADQLLRNADLAMYRAKTLGGGTVECYVPEMHVELVNRIELEGDLRRALGRGELRRTRLNRAPRAKRPLRGANSLEPPTGIAPRASPPPSGRGHSTDRPMGPPRSCRQAVIWHEQYPDRAPLTISVNISARQLERGDLIDDVANALRESGLPPQCLVLEMTESVLVEHTETNLEHVQTLKAMGIRLAIDDFGTGYSSLAYLHRFPVDILKIDSAFIPTSRVMPDHEPSSRRRCRFKVFGMEVMNRSAGLPQGVARPRRSRRLPLRQLSAKDYGSTSTPRCPRSVPAADPPSGPGRRRSASEERGDPRPRSLSVAVE